MNWEGTERRQIDAASFQLMAETRQMVMEQEKAMTEKITELKEDVEKLATSVGDLRHIIDQMPDTIVERIEVLIDEAFPSDPDFPDATPSEKRKLHRKYHARLIQHALEAQSRNKTLGERALAALVDKGVTLLLGAVLMYLGVKVV